MTAVVLVGLHKGGCIKSYYYVRWRKPKNGKPETKEFTVLIKGGGNDFTLFYDCETRMIHFCGPLLSSSSQSILIYPGCSFVSHPVTEEWCMYLQWLVLPIAEPCATLQTFLSAAELELVKKANLIAKFPTGLPRELQWSVDNEWEKYPKDVEFCINETDVLCAYRPHYQAESTHPPLASPVYLPHHLSLFAPLYEGLNIDAPFAECRVTIQCGETSVQHRLSGPNQESDEIGLDGLPAALHDRCWLVHIMAEKVLVLECTFWNEEHRQWMIPVHLNCKVPGLIPGITLTVEWRLSNQKWPRRPKSHIPIAATRQ